VVNLTTGEIRAELHSASHARDMADKLAEEGEFREQFAVVELVTIYETPRPIARP
jgi:hypothetical protein